jgi:uncharacterized protein (UPF0335 family)
MRISKIEFLESELQQIREKIVELHCQLKGEPYIPLVEDKTLDRLFKK